MFCIYYHEQNISALYLQLWLLSNVVRKQASHENGAVTYNPGKNRLVEIPTTGGKQSDNGLTEIQYTSQMWTVNFQHYGCPPTAWNNCKVLHHTITGIINS